MSNEILLDSQNFGELYYTERWDAYLNSLFHISIIKSSKTLFKVKSVIFSKLKVSTYIYLKIFHIVFLKQVTLQTSCIIPLR